MLTQDFCSSPLHRPDTLVPHANIADSQRTDEQEFKSRMIGFGGLTSLAIVIRERKCKSGLPLRRWNGSPLQISADQSPKPRLQRSALTPEQPKRSNTSEYPQLFFGDPATSLDLSPALSFPVPALPRFRRSSLKVETWEHGGLPPCARSTGFLGTRVAHFESDASTR